MGFGSGYGFTGLGNSSIPSDINILKNNEYKITYFESISTAAGTVAVPTNGTIMLDQFQSGADAYVSTIANGQPTGVFPQTSGGVPVDVVSFDALGNYILSGVPSSYPVAIIYIFKIKAINYPSVNLNYVLDSYQQDEIYSLIELVANATLSAIYPNNGYYVTFGTDFILPTAVGRNGTQIYLKNSSGVSINLTTTSSQTIDGNLSIIVVNNASYTFVSNGGNWLII